MGAKAQTDDRALATLGLAEYQKKRKFGKTPEPRGKILKAQKHRFVVQGHRTLDGRLHYDFRLEIKGVLKSWAVPKGVPEKPGIKRLAVAVEDHPISYLDFHGLIPEGQYGAGRVKIWDKGKVKFKRQEKNIIEFELSGKRLKGRFTLLQPKSFEAKNWLLVKSS